MEDKATYWRGDHGSTPLNPPEIQSAKDRPVVEALGTLQELSAALGLARALGKDNGLDELDDMLRQTQRHLYIVKCDFAATGTAKRVGGVTIPRPTEAVIAEVDRHVTRLEGKLGKKPDRFILEGGLPSAAALFVANEVTRRAERLFVRMGAETRDQSPSLSAKLAFAQRYLNHLSYQLYLMGRVTNRLLTGVEECIFTDPETGEVCLREEHLP